MLSSPPLQTEIRRKLRDGDAEAIAELHRRVYCAEYQRNEAFVAAVAGSVERAVARGWPQAGGGAWLVEAGGRVVGSLGLTDEGQGVGQIRWVVFEPALRGQGLGRRLLGEALDAARAAGMHKLQLETFSALKAAGHLYRDAGFRVVWERERTDWGPSITYQGYELTL